MLHEQPHRFLRMAGGDEAHVARLLQIRLHHLHHQRIVVHHHHRGGPQRREGVRVAGGWRPEQRSARPLWSGCSLSMLIRCVPSLGDSCRCLSLVRRNHAVDDLTQLGHRCRGVLLVARLGVLLQRACRRRERVVAGRCRPNPSASAPARRACRNPALPRPARWPASCPASARRTCAPPAAGADDWQAATRSAARQAAPAIGRSLARERRAGHACLRSTVPSTLRPPSSSPRVCSSRSMSTGLVR